jgi:hypothetical protein
MPFAGQERSIERSRLRGQFLINVICGLIASCHQPKNRAPGAALIACSVGLLWYP